MKTFQELREDIGDVQWKTDTMSIIFGLYSGGTPTNSDLYFFPLFPLTNKIKHIFTNNTRYAFHMTDYKGMRNVINIQNKKGKQISATTQFQPWMRGIQTDGRVGCLLYGDVLAQNPNDAMTIPDMSGRRWLSPYKFHTEYTIIDRIQKVLRRSLLKNFYSSFYKDLEKLCYREGKIEIALQEIVGEYYQEQNRRSTYMHLHEFFEMISSIERQKDIFTTNSIIFRYYKMMRFIEFKKLVQKYIEMYITIAEKVILSFSKEISEHIDDLEKMADDVDYNEVVIEDFKVEHVYLFDEFEEDKEDNNQVGISSDYQPRALYRKDYYKMLDDLKSNRIPYNIVTSRADWEEQYNEIYRTINGEW